MDKPGTAVGCHHKRRVNTQGIGKQAYNPLGIHLGQPGDIPCLLPEKIHHLRHGTQRIDIAAHVDNGIRRAVQLPGQFIDIAPVSFQHPFSCDR